MEKAEKQKAEKAKDVKPIIEECIRAGMDYSKTEKELKSRGLKYPNLSKTFYQWREKIQPEDARHDALQSIHDKREEKKSLLPTPKAWNKGKQKEVDESVFADVLNEGLFALIPCPHKNLKIEDVKQINLGGAIVGLVSYYTSVNLNHPIIIFISRALILVLKVRKMCYLIQEKYSEFKQKTKESLLRQGSIGSMQ